MPPAPLPGVASNPTLPDLKAGKQNRHRHTETEWKSRKKIIIQLYLEEGKTADQIVEILESDFSFKTGRRHLFKKLGQWGVRKNRKIGHQDIQTSSNFQDDITLSHQGQQSTTPTRPPPLTTSRTMATESSSLAIVHHYMTPFDDIPLAANEFWPAASHLNNSTPSLQPVNIADFPSRSFEGIPGTSPARLSGSRTPLHESWVGSPTIDSSGSNLDTVSSLEESLDRVTNIISGNTCRIKHATAFHLKKDLDSLLLLLQRTVASSEGNVHSFREGLTLTRSLLASSANVDLNTYTAASASHHAMLPAKVAWKRRWSTSRLSNLTLTVIEKTSSLFPDEFKLANRAQDQIWHFGTRLVLRAEKSNAILQIEVQQCEVPPVSITLPPRCVVSNTIPNNSVVFQIAEKGSRDELSHLLSTGQASLHDCDEQGASLLYFASRGTNAAVCEYLIQKGFDTDEIITEADGNETTPLRLSLRGDEMETSRVLLVAGADPTMKMLVDGQRKSVIDAMYDAMRPKYPHRTRKGYYMTRYLFHYAWHFGVSGYRIYDHRPLLHSLCDAANMPTWLSNSPEEWVDLFLNQGCQIDDRSKIGTCLHVFFRSQIHPPSVLGWQKALIRLVKEGADVHATDEGGMSISDIAYAELVCHELNNYDLGSYRGDLWDSVLHAHGYNVADFRQSSPRAARRYTHHYTREDFEQLWEGPQHSCPWDDDDDWIEHSNLHWASGDMVLCTCAENGPTGYFDIYDCSATCPNLREYQSGCMAVPVSLQTVTLPITTFPVDDIRFSER